MKEQEGTALYFPGETGWEWWKPARNGAWTPRKDAPTSANQQQNALHGFSAFACHSFPVWVSSDDPQITRQIVATELDLMSAPVTPEQSETQLAIRPVGRDGPRRLVQALLIPAELEADAPGGAEWVGFFPSPCALPVPRRRIALWRELGRWVVAFSREGRLVHFQSFGQGGLDGDRVREVACLYAELEGRDQVDMVEGVVIWSDSAEGSVPGESLELLTKILGVPVEIQPRPAPDTSLAAGIDVVPEAIVRERLQRRDRRRALQMACAIAAIYALVVAAAVLSLYRKQQVNRRLEKEIAILGPEAEVVRDARDRWDRLSPAVDADRYPVEVFHRVASLLPQKGIRLTHFEVRGNQVVVRGEASNVHLAISFKGLLEKSPELKDYEWRQPQPDIKGDTATFVAFGNYRYALTDES